MADNIQLPIPATNGDVVASDDIGGIKFQRVKLTLGGDGVDGGDVEATNPLPVTGTVTANTGLSQPLTDTQLRALAVPVSGTVTANTGLSQPLTDTQLRASAVPVSGTVTANTGLTQPLTDTQLRATPVPVSGTVTANVGTGTMAISAASLPLPSGAATESTLANLLTTTAFQTRIPVNGQATMAASLPVVIASNQTAIATVANATVVDGAAAQTAVVNNIITTVSGAAATASENFRAATVQVISTATGGTFIFEQSNDNVNFRPLPVFNAELVTGVPITAAITATLSQIVYTFPVRCRFIRLRIATTITGGSIQAFSRFSAAPWTASAQLVASNTAANLQATVSGTVTATVTAGTVNPVVPATPYILNSAASTNEALILTGTSGLQAFYATNIGATVAFVKLYNKATAPISSDTPAMILSVPAAVSGVPGVCTLPIGFSGFRFALGLGIRITGAVADADTTAVAAGQVKVMLSRTV
jgi:hypothetical protein